ncbi:MAG: prepilin-type N-terminal cleavage/methylation domain-containing protein [Planctomycetes bacterium]|nr:prepilin-type N-terminal cleavage/methylation domain-containing protein [Planctomycetota bacterium]
MPYIEAKRTKGCCNGFTLVELLVVISILGVLLGLLAWGANAARTSFLKHAQAAEVSKLAAAVEAYRLKYGDYPPDGFTWQLVESHLRKAFPEISNSELELLRPHAEDFSNTGSNRFVRNDNSNLLPQPELAVFDPAEALVFFLGGFSSDPRKPLTGNGGPFKEDPKVPGTWIYNAQRENAFFEFKLNLLTLNDDGTKSVDETLYDEGVPNDLLPVYVGKGPGIQRGGVPIVYFNSRSYCTPNAGHRFYVAGDIRKTGKTCARPFLANGSDIVFANQNSFQILSAGYDNLYGCQPYFILQGGPATLFAVPSGRPYSVKSDGTIVKTENDAFEPFLGVGVSAPSACYDNVSNFAVGPTFADSL